MAKQADQQVNSEEGKPQPSGKVLRVPISMALAEGGYTAKVYIGAVHCEANGIVPGRLANLALDTGSSALAVRQSVAKPELDISLKATSLAQAVEYGRGGWAGAIVETQLAIGEGQEQIVLPQAAIALIEEEPTHNFFEADGIWGLAYAPLDTVHDVEAYLMEQGVQPTVTYPWPLADEKDGQAQHLSIHGYRQLLKSYPEKQLTPYFTAIEEHGLVANKFALYTQRAFYHRAAKQEQLDELERDPLNHGWLVLGGGECQTDLYHGEFMPVSVLHDVYYNTHLKQFEVAGFAPIDVDPLEQKYQHSYISNSIIDSGASFILLTGQLYQYLNSCLHKISPDLANQLKNAAEKALKLEGVPMQQLQLADWPTLTFTLKGEFGDVTLELPPEHYWQVNAPLEGLAMMVLQPPLDGWANQTILGLPLMNNYFCVFDRAEHETGVVKFAERRPFAE